MCSNIPSWTAYVVFISQLLQYMYANLLLLVTKLRMYRGIFKVKSHENTRKFRKSKSEKGTEQGVRKGNAGMPHTTDLF